MELFQIVNNHAVPSIHALLISPFKEIWEEDTSPDKIEATKIFSYVELLCNPRKSNPFAGYSEQERPAKVKKIVWGDEHPNISEQDIQKIMYCITEYKALLEIASPSYGLWIDASNAVHKLRKFLRGFDLDERLPKTGGLVLKPRDVVVALAGLDDVETSMQKQRDKVQGELTDNTKTRNLREIGAFER